MNERKKREMLPSETELWYQRKPLKLRFPKFVGKL